MRKVIALFLVIVLILVASCSLDLSTSTKYISVFNNSASPVLVSMDPFVNPEGYRLVFPNDKTAWTYEAEENCTAHISVYQGEIIIVNGSLVLDPGEISSVGDYGFTPGENYTNVLIDENFLIVIEAQ